MIQAKKITTAISVILLGLLFAAYAEGATVKRSNFLVRNIACISCLAAIETQLQQMDGVLNIATDLRRDRVIVDHLDTLSHEQIAAAISRMGYPAEMEWSATLPGSYTTRTAEQNQYGSENTGKDYTGKTGTGPATWNSPPAGSTVSRTTLRVSNLSCISCLSSIAEELARLANTYGMAGYLSRGIIIVDHAADLESDRIAAIISGLGYPTRVMATNYIPARKSFAPVSDQNGNDTEVRPGSTCNSSGPCNATAASWQKLYNRYFNKTDSN